MAYDRGILDSVTLDSGCGGDKNQNKDVREKTLLGSAFLRERYYSISSTCRSTYILCTNNCLSVNDGFDSGIIYTK
jgi:hypothetical protein